MSSREKSTSKKARIVKSMFITDPRDEIGFGKFTYVYAFDESMVPARAWEALMALEANGKFYFANVGDCGFHALVDNMKNCKMQKDALQEFFNLAMVAEHQWPRNGCTREQSMKQLGNCTWVVNMVEE